MDASAKKFSQEIGTDGEPAPGRTTFISLPRTGDSGLFAGWGPRL